MNYIVLEGLTLYSFLILVVLLLIIATVSLICVVLSDKRNFVLCSLLSRENSRVRNLLKENFVLKLKYGELNVDEE